jgi:hypothetical protein
MAGCVKSVVPTVGSESKLYVESKKLFCPPECYNCNYLTLCQTRADLEEQHGIRWQVLKAD